MLEDLNRLLIVRLRNLGDCVLMTPVVEALRRWRPELEITVLVEQRFAPAFSGNPNITRLEIVSGDRGPLGRYRARFDAVARLRGQQYDWV